MNDFDYETFFARQLEALGTPGDILFLISTSGGDRKSGASMNLVMAGELALSKNIKLFSLVGKNGGELSRISHQSVRASSYETSHIQEAHIAIIHSICLLLDGFAAD